jgi:sterol 3beta-glucosyltransferase
MKALLVVHGSRGDVQPFLALARGLTGSGWQAAVAAPARFADLAAAYGVGFHPLDDALLDLQDLAARGGVRTAVTAARQARPLLRRVLDTAAQALQDGSADVVVHHPKALAGPHLAEALGVPAQLATLLPLYVPTREFALPVLPDRVRRLTVLNRSTWRLTSMIDAPYAGMIRTWRREVLRLPPRSRADLTTDHLGRPAPLPLHAWSPQVLPPPADWPAPAAPIGYWVAPAPAGWTPPADLVAFLDAGPRPVYIGFGSMVGRDPSSLTSVVLDAVRAAGVRAVLATGWGGLRPQNGSRDDVLVTREVPHDWLFPRVAAVVHHGGAGTVAAAARAGRPQLIRPFLADQPFWARQVHRLGLGPPPLAGRLSTDRLAAALASVVRDEQAGERARSLAAALGQENGVAAAERRLSALVAGETPR